MKTVQILMEEALLSELDKLAKGKKLDRSKVVRLAIKRYLAAAKIEAWEQSDIEAYKRKPMTQREIDAWSKVRAWPKG